MLSFWEMLRKENQYLPLSSAPSFMKNIFYKHAAFALVALMLSVGFFIYKGVGETLIMRLPMAAAPFLFGVFFVVLAWRVYLICRTGQYQVIEGECTFSPRGVNPVSMIQNFSKNMVFTFHMTDEGGINAYIVNTTRRLLPKEGAKITLAVPLNGMIKESQTEFRVMSYLALKTIVHKKKDGVKDAKKEER